MKPQHRYVQHRVEISSRRRALFPSDDNSGDSDLGCISPLNFDDDVCLKNDKGFSLDNCVGDYDIIGLVDKGTALSTPKSTFQDETPLDVTVITPSHVTDLDDSPTQKLKTPHDTSTNTKLPKLTRKIVTDTILTESPSHNQQDLDSSRSKVRTALFPEMSFSSKAFYPQTQTKLSPSLFRSTKKHSRKKPTKKNKLYLCSRQSRLRSGQINAGVGHKIRRIKSVKKTKNVDLLQAAIDIIENSPLNSVLNNSQNMNLGHEPRLEPVLSENRQLSPEPEPEPDPSKKFFKSSRHKGVVTVNQNIKLEVNNGKISLMNTNVNKANLKRTKKQGEISSKRFKLSNEFDSEPNENLISTREISGIINSLEDKENTDKKQDSIILMSPTSQMCNMTSGLALNSPKKAKNLNTVLETMPASSEQKKLYPVFYPGKISVPPKSDYSKNSNSVKKFKGLSKDQMLLDAGQKRFGVTQCSECNIIYHMGDPGDEIMHINYHNAGHIFRFNGWKNERVVSNELLDGKIIQIVPTDSKIWWKKVKDVMEVINRDLGFYDIEFNTLNSQIFFYIKNKIIVGVLAAESKTTAYKLLTTHQDQVDLCSEESYAIKCGVSRVWVSQNYRKRGIATALMDCLKRNFMFGYILKNEDIAFSSPTEMGKLFGKSYFKTPNFLIYFI